MKSFPIASKRLQNSLIFQDKFFASFFEEKFILKKRSLPIT